MNPFYFGPSERPLFGVFSQGRSRGSASGAVLLCYPVAGEYLRAHRAFRQLSNLLSRSGLSVLRFDYSCTGDSGGPGEDARLADWLDDVDWAVDELTAMVGVDRVSMVGLRFGAVIAALASADRTDVHRLVLWDPTVSGDRYVRELVGEEEVEGTIGVEGVPVTAELRAEIRGVDLTRLEKTGAESVEILVAQDGPEYRSLHRTFEGMGVPTHYEIVPSSGSWTEPDPFGSAYIPEQIIQTIVQRLAASAGAAS